jgi:hypothetical protein
MVGIFITCFVTGFNSIVETHAFVRWSDAVLQLCIITYIGPHPHPPCHTPESSTLTTRVLEYLLLTRVLFLDHFGVDRVGSGGQYIHNYA